MIVNILGTDYDVSYKHPSEDEMLNSCDGYCDRTSKTIVVTTKNTNFDDFESYQKECLRHELIHAFMFESGLSGNWEHKDYGHEETVVDWFAIQSPKIIKTFYECGVL